MYRNLYFTLQNWCLNWWPWNCITYLNIFHHNVHFVIHSWHHLQNWTILRLKKMFFRRLLFDYWAFTSSWRNSRLYQKILCWRTLLRIQNLGNDSDSITLGIVRSSTWKKSSHQIITKIIQKWKVRACSWNWRDLKINRITWRKVRTLCWKIP